MKSHSTKNLEHEISIKNTLSSSLQHLEFILFFEMHLEQKQKLHCSKSFLREFKDLKHDAQMNILKYSSDYKES